MNFNLKHLLMLVGVALFTLASCGKCKDVDCTNGECDKGDCICDEGWTGVNCSEAVSFDNVVKSGNISSDETWTADRIYELNGKVVVESGATLTIEAGTIVKGQEGAGANASALVIARGAEIMAEGTASAPIIFTSTLDNIEIGQITGTNLSKTDQNKWGGLIVLGNAKSSTENGDTEGVIEGLPANEAYSKYGGTNDADNSGVIRYVSIRHGGAEIGEGNEINGLTLGGVGNGTTVEFVEVVANLDDGIECFGGSVDITNALVMYQGDDAFDIDQNYSGTMHNIMAKHGIDTDNALEIDGPEGSTYTDGLFEIHHATFISTDGEGRAGTLKSKAQGSIMMSKFEGYGSWVRLRAKHDEANGCADKSDAYLNFTSTPASLQLMNNDFVYDGTIDPLDVYDGDDADNCDVTNAQQDNADNVGIADGNQVVASSTKGADQSVFNNWTWASANNEL